MSKFKTGDIVDVVTENRPVKIIKIGPLNEFFQCDDGFSYKESELENQSNKEINMIKKGDVVEVVSTEYTEKAHGISGNMCGFGDSFIVDEIAGEEVYDIIGHVYSVQDLIKQNCTVKKASETQIAGNHYSKLKIQPMRYALENELNYGQANAVKYITRYKDKNGIEDLKKAIHCIELLIEFEESVDKE